MWTRVFMRTAFIFLITITALTRGLSGNAERWIQLADGVNLGVVETLEAGENRLYAGASYGIFISDDRGRTWRHMSDFNITALRIAVDGNTVYVGTYWDGMFRSDDAGESWKPIRDGLPFYESDDGERRYGRIRRILARRGKVINVMYHGGTYTSTDRGETWHDVSEEWWRGNSIRSMTEFDGYLWSAISVQAMSRSLDNGKTWEGLPELKLGYADDWAVLNNRLYVAGERGIGRWNEEARTWECLMEGLPTGNSRGPDDPPRVHNLAIHRGRLFAGLDQHGVYVFDARAETWYPVGLNGHSVYALLSYNSALYAGTSVVDCILAMGPSGIYRAEIPRIVPHGKAVTTWASVKYRTLAKD